ncbi:hypothetical protein H0H87_010297, partial [Tephrocybe sp. NHM501043]
CLTINHVAQEMQECIVTKNLKYMISHANDDIYLINMHALHNAHLIQESLPRHLTAPRPYVEDRIAHWECITTQLCILGPEKQAETEKK